MSWIEAAAEAILGPRVGGHIDTYTSRGITIRPREEGVRVGKLAVLGGQRVARPTSIPAHYQPSQKKGERSEPGDHLDGCS